MKFQIKLLIIPLLIITVISLIIYSADLDSTSRKEYSQKIYSAYQRNCDRDISFDDFKLLYNMDLLRCKVK